MKKLFLSGILYPKNHYSHIYRIMRLTIFLLLCSVGLGYAGNANSQNARVNLNKQLSILREVLEEIEQQTDYLFVSSREVNLSQIVSVRAKNKPVREVLEQIFQNTDISYSMEGVNIVLTKNPEHLDTAQQNQKRVTGTVTDEKGDPIIGVNVIIKGTHQGSITDMDGKFSLSVPDDALLQITYIGYIAQEIPVKNNTNFQIILQEDLQLLDEVVVVGYGTMRKKDLTGAVGTLKTEQLQVDQPRTVQDMLRTGMAGLQIGIATNTKGDSNMLIRGERSIGRDNIVDTRPLIVLDGVIYAGEMTDINPNDVEQIDMLKDASSAAVYGAKSANGVILITTKKGKGSKPLINFSSTIGLSMKNSLPAIYQGSEYLDYRQAVMESTYPTAGKGQYANPNKLPAEISLDEWMAYTNATGDPEQEWLRRLALSVVENTNYLAGKTVNWEDVVFKDVALQQDYSVSIAGNKNEVNYYSSLNYVKNENNVRGGGYDAIRARVNLESKASNIITYGLNAQFTSRNEGYTAVNQDGYKIQSPYGSVYEEDGSPKIFPHDDNNAKNPIIDAHYTDKKYTINNINASAYLKIDLPFGFSIQSTYSPRYEYVKELVHQSSDHPDWSKKGGMAKRRHKEVFYWQWDNTLKWNKEFGKNSFDATFLFNLEKNQTWESTMDNDNFMPSDVLGYGYIKAGLNPVINSNDQYSTGDAYMGRLHYMYDRKYMLTLTIRRDGYSAFGQSNPRATFPSAALGWVFSEEGFFPKDTWFEYGKLRFSWGKNGNRGLNNIYQALMDMSARKYMYASATTGEVYSVNAYYANRMANSKLKWESTAALNAGLDFSLLRGRLGGSIDVYKMNTTDLLSLRVLPNIVGYSNVMSNLGEVQNTGFEITLNSTNIENNKFRWNTSFNVSFNKNKIKKLYGDMVDVKDDDGNVIGQKEADDSANGWFIGQSKNVIWNYKVIGVWQENEIEEAAKYGVRPGDFKILDVDKNYKYTNEDKVFQGETSPTARLSMRNEFNLFKNLTVSVTMYSFLGYKGEFGHAKHMNTVITRQNDYKIEYWTPENPTNKYARLNSGSAGLDYKVYRNKSFVRLDNISVSYTFPKRLIEPFRISNLRGTVSMKNVGFWAPDWEFGDPENSGKNTPRTLYFGLNLTL